MKKKTLRLYGFKLKDADIVNLFNESDLFGYEKDESGKWTSNGFGWLVNNPTYIIDTYYDYFKTESWEALTEAEFNEIVKDNLKDFDCHLIDSNYPIEKLFNKSVIYENVTKIDDMEKYPFSATFSDVPSMEKDDDEPNYLRYSELFALIEDGEGFGEYRIIY